MKHNPALLSETELIADFVVHQAELRQLVEWLLGAAPSSHQLVLGKRGAGKTTLVRRFAAEVCRTPELAREWIPVSFAEEAYNVTTTGELWLETLFHIADQSDDTRWREVYEQLKAERDPERLHEHGLEQLLTIARTQERRLLLIVENLQDILGFQMRAPERERLLATLREPSPLTVLATAAEHSDELDAVIEAGLFASIELTSLDADDCRRVWSHFAGVELPGASIRPIQIMTGGDLRLLRILGSFAAGGSLEQLMDDLLHLVDDLTPYFKSIVEALSRDERRVLTTLCELWRPSLSREIAREMRTDSNKTSSSLSRLRASGLIEVTQNEGRAQRYQVRERLFNIYYLIRRRGSQRARVRALAEFIVHLYPPDLWEQSAERVAFEADPKAIELRVLMDEIRTRGEPLRERISPEPLDEPTPATEPSLRDETTTLLDAPLPLQHPPLANGADEARVAAVERALFERGELVERAELEATLAILYAVQVDIRATQIHTRIDQLLRAQGQLDELEALALWALRSAPRPSRARVAAHASLAGCALHRQDRGLAIDHTEQAIELARDLADHEALGHMYCNLGGIHESTDTAAATRAFERALESFEDSDGSLRRARVLRRVSAFYRGAGADPARSFALAREALGIFTEFGIEDEMARCLRDLGHDRARVERWADASRYFERARGLFERLELAPELVHAICDIGAVHGARAELEAMDRCYDEAFERAQAATEEPAAVVEVCHGLAGRCANQGYFERAHAWFERALEHASALGDRRRELVLWREQAMALASSGRLADAITKLSLAADASVELGLLTEQGFIWGQRGNFRYQLEQLDEAELDFRESLRVYTSLGDPVGCARQHLNLGITLTQRGDLDGAVASYQLGLALIEGRGQPEVEVQLMSSYASLASARGDTDALELHARACACAEASGDDQTLMMALDHHAAALHGGGEHRLALAMLDRQVRIAAKMGATQAEALIRVRMSDILVELGELDAALVEFERSAALFEQIGEVEVAAMRLQVAAVACMGADWNDLALEYSQRTLDTLPPDPSTPRVAALTAFGMMLLQAARVDEAIEAMQTALAQASALPEPNPDSEPAIRMGLGAALSRAQRFDEAVGEMERAIELLEQKDNETGLAQALSALAALHLNAERPAASLPLLERALQLRTSPEIRTDLMSKLGMVLFAVGQFDRGVEVFTKLRELSEAEAQTPLELSALAAIIVGQVNRGDVDAALSGVEQLLDLDLPKAKAARALIQLAAIAPAQLDELLSVAPPTAGLEPLQVALALELGRSPNAPQEVLEVAKDVRKLIRSTHETLGTRTPQ